MKILPYLLLGSLGLGTAQAQTRFQIGPRLGGNLAFGPFSNLNQPTGAGVDETYSSKALLCYQVGLAASIGSGHWAFQPALLLSQKGIGQRSTFTYTVMGIQAQDVFQADTRVNYLELPLNAVYSFGQNGQGFQVFAGPYLALGVGGHVSYTATETASDPAYNQSVSSSQPLRFGDTFVAPDPTDPDAEPDARTRRFDAGFSAGVGYRRGPVQAQLGYSLGLLNVQPAYPASYQFSDDTGYNRAVQLAVTYFFAPGGK